MDNKKYQVFISSTFTDLEQVRHRVFNNILSLYQFPVGMELFGSDDDEQWEFIESVIRESDYYILIIGHRYGSLAKDGVSYTEKEFDLAYRLKIPIMAFIQKRDVPTKPNHREDDPEKIQKLNQFIDKVTNGRMVDFWEDEKDLCAKISNSFIKNMKRHPRVGWVRADQAVSPEIIQEMAKLTSENRELRNQLEALKQQNNKKPQIGLRINDKKEIELEYQDVNVNLIETIQEIEMDEVFIKEYLNQEEVAHYNAMIHEKIDEVTRYNEDLIRYQKVQDLQTDILFSVHNNGTCKAENIFVDITFPPEILVLDKREVEKMKSPKRPDLPPNPIKVARNRQAKLLMGSSAYEALGGRALTDFLHLRPDLTEAISWSAPISNPNYWSEVENNKVTIKVNSLVHTRQYKIDDEEFVLVPMKRGVFEAKISIICEQYEGKEEDVLIIRVN